LSFIAPHNIRLRYQLAGYDKNWVEIKDRRAVYYTNLKPGHYKFEVVAANADGVWNEVGDGVEIELSPYYYQTAWFVASCVGLACIALLGLVALRVRHLHQKQVELQRTRERLEAEVQSRTAELAKANGSLQQKTRSLEQEIEERRRMQLEVERVQRELLETSRRAGMSEIATNVLHNVGNVLNSVNVSATLVAESVKRSKLDQLTKVIAMLRDHEHDLGAFITNDPKGRLVPAFLAQLCEVLFEEQAKAVRELDSLTTNVAHIKEIVAMQQDYARVAGVKEFVNVQDLIEDSLRLNLESFGRHGIEITRDYQKVPAINLEKHKLLQILVNLIRNAKHACAESGRGDKRVVVRVANEDGRIKISVTDNGVGIPRENLTRIFNHGFTTRKHGHGFGLHSGALAAKELGGSLTVHSEGQGLGAAFIVDLPTSSSN